MSNHGKESTNEEGVNIDEMQMKIDMGKLITLLETLYSLHIPSEVSTRSPHCQGKEEQGAAPLLLQVDTRVLNH
jgi:hypothetical protein